MWKEKKSHKVTERTLKNRSMNLDLFSYWKPKSYSFNKKKKKKKKDSQKVSEKHGLKINCLGDIWYIHFKKNVFGYLKTYMEICVSENVCRNTWYLKTKNVCLSGCIKHLLKKEKRKIVILFGVGLSLTKNFYVFLGFIYIVLIF